MPFDTLFSPIKLRGLELPNRVVMSAMGTHMSYASEDKRSVTEQIIGYHVARARGGCGLNTTEVCAVDAASAPFGFLSIADDKHLPSLRRLAEAVHEAGGRIMIQLWQGSLAVSHDPDAERLIPSALPEYPAYCHLPEMTEERILSVIRAYGEGARRACEAGFDAIEYHCGHNYLPHSFLSGAFNRRSDRWGGNLENRMRFPLECIKAIRANMPEEMPLFMRIDSQDDMVENGLTPEEVIAFCREAGKLGVDVLNVSRGNTVSAANYYEVPPVDLPNGYNVDAAARIRRETGMLTMPCGRINTPQLADELIRQEKADLVVMARAQLADPEFCNKAKAGQLNAIKYCIGCDQGCYDRFFVALTDPSIDHIRCTRNPFLCEEFVLSLGKAESPKKVLIAGGGIGGIEAADALYRRGHHPVLCEASGQLGGQLMLAGKTPRREDFRMAVERAIANLQDEGVDIRLNTPVTPELIEKERPDALIIAIGSVPAVSSIPGAENEHVFYAPDILTSSTPPLGRVAVIGAGYVGVGVAEYLAERGAAVTLIGAGKVILQDLGLPRRVAARTAMKDAGITPLLKTSCRKIEPGKITVETAGKRKELKADAVVIAGNLKYRNFDELAGACGRLGIPWYLVGNTKNGKFASDSVRDAYDAALKI